MNSRKHIFLYIIIIFVLITIPYLAIYKFNNRDTFYSPQTKKPNIDGTQLYGSLFLDNLNGVITNMTDPPIMYDTKTIELNKYSDLLL